VPDAAGWCCTRAPSHRRWPARWRGQRTATVKHQPTHERQASPETRHVRSPSLVTSFFTSSRAALRAAAGQTAAFDPHYPYGTSSLRAGGRGPAGYQAERRLTRGCYAVGWPLLADTDGRPRGQNAYMRSEPAHRQEHDDKPDPSRPRTRVGLPGAAGGWLAQPEKSGHLCVGSLAFSRRFLRCRSRAAAGRAFAAAAIFTPNM
jgi:hypothetical protein